DCRRCGSKRCIHSSKTQRKTKEKKKKSLQNKKFSNKALTEYISYDVPVGKGRNDLRSYIGVIVCETISILLNDWRRVPLEMKETLKVQFELEMQKPSIKWMDVALRNFRSELAKEFILPYKDDIKSLRLPPIEYPSIQKEDWKLFVNKILS
ncbi:hypothetical protein CISIN_1g042880mg, partial [Citrus sinensis]